MRILLVEDDSALAMAMVEALTKRAIDVDTAENAEDAWQMMGVAQYAAALLDLGLPDGSGLDLIARLRTAKNPLPVLVTTARGAPEDRVAGLNLGADDYIVKPFDIDELVARLHAVLRRQGSLSAGRIEAGNVALDPQSGDLYVDDRHIVLSARERQLAELLLRRTGQVVSKRLAEDQLFGLSDGPGSNAVEVYAHRLRRKLEGAEANVRIETIRGVGYLLRTVR